MNLKSLALCIPPIRRLHRQRDALLARVAKLEGELKLGTGQRDYAAQQAVSKRELLEEEVAVGEQLEAHLTKLEARFARLEELMTRPDTTGGSYEQGEVVSCRALAPRCVFIIGFARSSTTLLLSMLNSASNALILGEANFFYRKDDPFHGWYNAQHVGYRNQPTKSTHAPDFAPNADYTWWQWLNAAADFYAVLGDKMAFSSFHLSQPGPEAIQRFFEARFFKAKYLLLLRNPVDTLLSTAKLMCIEDDAALARECVAWLRYVQLWADWIRCFPHTLTLVADDLGPGDVGRIAGFTGLALEGVDSLLHEGNRRLHEIPGHFPTLAAIKGELMEIFDLAKSALAEPPATWQAEQKRSGQENQSRGTKPGQIAVVPRALGHAWAKAEDLCVKLGGSSIGQQA